MRDQLIGYLIGSLEPEEHRAVEAQIASDPELRRWLDLLEASLAPLAADAGHLPAPAGLAARTCRRVMNRPIAVASHPRVARASWSWSDLAVAAGIFLAASLLFFPAVNASREKARIAYCQNNLRMIGNALAEYSQVHGGYLPYVPPNGLAGWYAPTLVHNGFLSSNSVLLCPGSTLAREKEFVVPTIDQTIEQAGGPHPTSLVRVRQRTVGGSYGYTLGYLDDGRYQPMRNLARANYPVMSDAPAGDPAALAAMNHATGHNVLFDDGHASLLAQPVRARTSGGLDQLFTNDSGAVAAGLFADDAVIGSSDSIPVPGAR